MKNVVASDGTLILNKGSLSQGTKLTYDCTEHHLKPCLIIQLDAKQMIQPHQAIRWIKEFQISILNIAGPRESKYPEGIYKESYSYLKKVFTLLKEDL